MALVDPKSYVSLPPGLIYDADDLERETYKALLQVVGWMWVCRWWEDTPKVKALRTSIEELAARWGVAERTVYYRLQALGDKGYLQIERKSDGLAITLGPRTLRQDLRHASNPDEASGLDDTLQAASATCACGDTQAARGGDIQAASATRAGGTHTGHERWQDELPGILDPEVVAQQAASATRAGGDTQAARGGDTTGRERRQDEQAARGTRGDCKQLATDAAFASSLQSPTIISSSCSESDPGDLPDQSRETTTTSTPGDAQEELRAALLGGGVFPDRVSRLASDPWVTVDRVERWILDLQRQLEREPGCIRKVGAVLYSNLLNHREPPPRPLTQAEKWQKWQEEVGDLELPPDKSLGEEVDEATAEAQQLWRNCLGELRLQMTKATFDSWLVGSKVIAAENGTITIGVRHAYAVDWLQNRLMSVIQRTIDRRAGGRDLSVRFVAL